MDTSVIIPVCKRKPRRLHPAEVDSRKREEVEAVPSLGELTILLMNLPCTKKSVVEMKAMNKDVPGLIKSESKRREFAARIQGFDFTGCDGSCCITKKQNHK
jgi:hypothetical protein